MAKVYSDAEMKAACRLLCLTQTERRLYQGCRETATVPKNLHRRQVPCGFAVAGGGHRADRKKNASSVLPAGMKRGAETAANSEIGFHRSCFLSAALLEVRSLQPAANGKDCGFVPSVTGPI